MASSADSKASRSSLAIGWSVAVLAALAAAWYFATDDHAPTRQDAEKFLDWGLNQESGGIPGLRGDGAAIRLTGTLVSAMLDVECHGEPADRSLLQRLRRDFSRFDCIYRLSGGAGETYLAVIAAEYMSEEQYDIAQVDPYLLTFRAEADLRRILADHGMEPGQPAN